MNYHGVGMLARYPFLIAAYFVLGMTTLLAEDVVEGSERLRRLIVYPPVLPKAKVETYKIVKETELRLWLFEPQGHRDTDRTPAVVFFFGGGWNSGSPTQFAEQARYLASRGLVAILVDYRVASRHKSTIVDSIKDGRSAMRWVRCNAVRLGIDPRRIGASGGSAGGHLAVATATLEAINESGEDTGVSATPDALLLFNPGLALADAPLRGIISNSEMGIVTAPAGAALEEISPYDHVRPGMPPTLIFNGRDDNITLFSFALLFADRVAEHGNSIKVVGFDGEGHGFFNYGMRGNWAFVATMRKVDEFLVALGWLSGEPTMEASTRSRM